MLESGNFDHDDDEDGGEPGEPQVSEATKLPTFQPMVEEEMKYNALSERKGTFKEISILSNKRPTVDLKNKLKASGTNVLSTEESGKGGNAVLPPSMARTAYKEKLFKKDHSPPMQGAYSIGQNKLNMVILDAAQPINLQSLSTGGGESITAMMGSSKPRTQQNSKARLASHDASTMDRQGRTREDFVEYGATAFENNIQLRQLLRRKAGIKVDDGSGAGRKEVGRFAVKRKKASRDLEERKMQRSSSGSQKGLERPIATTNINMTGMSGMAVKAKAALLRQVYLN